MGSAEWMVQGISHSEFPHRLEESGPEADPGSPDFSLLSGVSDALKVHEDTPVVSQLCPRNDERICH